MAAAVNGVNSTEFAKNDDPPAKDDKDDATAGNDPVPEVKDEDPDFKEEVNLEWENNANGTNGPTSNNSTVNVNNFSLEDMPIIILQQPTKEIKIVQTKKISFVCKVCRKLFPSTQSLQEHSLQCKIIGCPLCNFRTVEESLFKEHWQFHQDAKQVSKATSAELVPGTPADNAPKNFVCPNCSKKYKTENHLKMHVYRCEKTRCKLCDYETYKSYELRRHFLNNHINPEENIRVCPRCHKVLKNKHSLSTHMWICGKIPRCECHHCGYKTFNKYNLRTHILAKHLQPGVVREDSVLKTLHTEKVVVPFVVDSDPLTQKVCGLCTKIFTNQRALSAHSIHCKLYECSKCPFETFKKAHLKKHIDINHKAKQPALMSQPDSSSSVPEQPLLISQPNTSSSVPNLAASVSQPDVSSLVPKQPLLISQPDTSSSVPKLASPISQPDVNSSIPKQDSPTSQPTISSSVPKPVSPTNEQEVSSPEPQPASPMNQDDESLSLPASPMSSQDTSSTYAETEQMCQICYEIFQNKQALLAHALYCREYECPHCSYKTYIKADLTNHIIQRHEQRKVKRGADCPKCGKNYKNQHVVNTHLMYCGKEFVKCSYCPYKTRRSTLLQAHVKSAHPSKMEVEEEEEEEEEDDTITCDQCGQTLKSNETMRYHSFYCPRKPFLDCNMCSFKTRYALCLKNHVLRVHCQSNQQSYECPKCSGQLRTLEIFKKHLVTCIPQSVLRCSLCTYMTRDPSCLSDHVMDKHYKDDPSDTSDIKLIPCPKCGNKLKNPLSLRSHLMHCEKEREFACKHCPFKARTKPALGRHLHAKHTSKH